MHVVHHAHLPCRRDEGCVRLDAAGPAQGLRGFEVRLIALDPGACLVADASGGELAVVVLEGSGKLLLDGAPQRFQAPCSLLVPPGVAASIVNSGAVQSRLVWVAARAR